MRRWLQAVLFTAATFVLVWILKQVFPKNSGALIFFLVFLLLDAFLWFETRKRIRLLKPLIRYLLICLYWIPISFVLAGVIYGFFSTYYYWGTFVKTYLTSFVFLAYIAKSIPMVFAILCLGIQGVLFLISTVRRKKSNYPKIPELVFRTGWVLGIAMFALLMTGMIFWSHKLRIREVEITLKDLPRSFDHFRVVQIADLHLGSWNSKELLAEDVEIINSLDPDLVFVTGDLCDYCTADALPFRNILAKIRAKHGIYTVLGNHDYGDYMTWTSPEAKEQNLADLCRLYQDLGWKLLRNEHEIIKIGTDSITILGVENWGSISRFQRFADLPGTLTGVEKMATKILLSHDPTYWDSIVSNQYPEIELTFSGHTHGGQIGYETAFGQWSFVEYFYPRWAGLYSLTPGKPPYLYVNRGLGNIGYAGRIGIWTEITLVILTCGNK
ncbi:MAG: metallophosphoesterase [bacterium]